MRIEDKFRRMSDSDRLEYLKKQVLKEVKSIGAFNNPNIADMSLTVARRKSKIGCSCYGIVLYFTYRENSCVLATELDYWSITENTKYAVSKAARILSNLIELEYYPVPLRTKLIRRQSETQ